MVLSVAVTPCGLGCAAASVCNVAQRTAKRPETKLSLESMEEQGMFRTLRQAGLGLGVLKDLGVVAAIATSDKAGDLPLNAAFWR